MLLLQSLTSPVLIIPQSNRVRAARLGPAEERVGVSGRSHMFALMTTRVAGVDLGLDIRDKRDKQLQCQIQLQLRGRHPDADNDTLGYRGEITYQSIWTRRSHVITRPTHLGGQAKRSESQDRVDFPAEPRTGSRETRETSPSPPLEACSSLWSRSKAGRVWPLSLVAQHEP